ncbi:MAG TPA: cytochrome c peroxidase [Bacteroidia bacterium]|nr:cytochrome c peroxidase [Bacteroidia bacterium]
MKKITVLSVFTIIAAVVSVSSCKREAPGGEIKYQEPSLPAVSYDYNARASILTTNNHSVSNAKATLGRVLFYDKAMSVNNLISCGSCHHQNKAFSDGMQFSQGFEFKTTTRNSPAIINPGAMNTYFWDGRATGLDNMVLMPVANHIEMGLENVNYLVSKIASIPYYKPLFKDAYGSEDVNKTRIADALSDFLASMVTVNSKFDQAQPGGFQSFTTLEKHGLDLFNGAGCSDCHAIGNFGWHGERFANIGLEMEYTDKGMGEVTAVQQHEGFFKVPSLRNIEITGPYMHDGRFKTLEEVIEHYNSGIQNHPNLDWSLRNQTLQMHNMALPPNLQRPIIGGPNDPFKLSLTETDKKALVAFLKTLTDVEYTTSPLYSDPFRN